MGKHEKYKKKSEDSRDVWDKVLDNPLATIGGIGGAVLGAAVGSRGGRKIMKIAQTSGSRDAGRSLAISGGLPGAFGGASFGTITGAISDREAKKRRRK